MLVSNKRQCLIDPSTFFGRSVTYDLLKSTPQDVGRDNSFPGYPFYLTVTKWLVLWRPYCCNNAIENFLPSKSIH